MQRPAAVLGLALFAVGAFASATYQVNITPKLNGLDVKIETIENPGGLIVRLTNNTDQKVRCKLRYDAQPQPLARKTIYVDAGKTEDSTFLAKRQWFNVDVEVECEPAAKQ
jgi:hypothetical protein